jgi:phytoene dehydrogenase-like protein
VSPQPEVLVVGAGLSGLACALHLHVAGVPVRVLEASDGVGGRVRTDLVAGFRLDRGFQVLLTAYPETRRVLDYAALDLKPFLPGALVRRAGRFHEMSDPWRRPDRLVGTLLADVGTLADRLRIARYRARVGAGSVDDLFRRPNLSALERLRGQGFSEAMIDAFFRPLFGGVLLDRALGSSSRMLDFVFRMMAEGDVALPATGMGAIPEQLLRRLPEGTVRLGVRVASLSPREVRLESGETMAARAVVVATEGPEAARLTGQVPALASRSVTALYFAADRAPIERPILILDGDGRGPVNNLCFPSQIAPSYAPPGAVLVAASVLEDAEAASPLEPRVRTQLAEWFGPQTSRWQLLRAYRIAHAQPDQTPPALDPVERPVELPGGLFVCGDHRDTASLHGALLSGRRAAEAVTRALEDSAAERPSTQ